MKKVLAIARAEFLQAVRSKAFLIGLFVMPILMGGGIAFQVLVKDKVDLDDRVCAVVDPTGELWPVLEAAAAERNAKGIWKAPDEDAAGDEAAPKQLRPKLLLERFEPAAGERADLALSRRVAAGELQGFVLVDPGVLGDEPLERPLAYHTDEPTFTELPEWIERVVNDFVRQRRFDGAGLDRALVERLDRPVSLSTWGLVKQKEDGEVAEAEKDNKARTFGIPFAGLMLMFMFVMTSAPQLMNQVLEEKMQRISEVLVSAVSPFQLMLGKLLSGVGVSLTLAAIYLGGVYWATHHYGVSQYVPLTTYVWFVVLMIFALLTYGALFSALGSACSELRDAQSLMMPAMILLMVPLFSWSAVLESPNGSIAVGLTYLPTATPMILLVRVLSSPGPPAIELVLGLLLCVATAIAFVWAGARIFRIGILSQSQTPSFRQLARWVFSGS